MQLLPHAFPFVQILQHASVGSTDHSLADSRLISRGAGALELAVVVPRTKSAVKAITRAASIIRPRYALAPHAGKGHTSHQQNVCGAKLTSHTAHSGSTWDLILGDHDASDDEQGGDAGKQREIEAQDSPDLGAAAARAHASGWRGVDVQSALCRCASRGALGEWRRDEARELGVAMQGSYASLAVRASWGKV